PIQEKAPYPDPCECPRGIRQDRTRSRTVSLCRALLRICLSALRGRGFPRLSTFSPGGDDRGQEGNVPVNSFQQSLSLGVGLRNNADDPRKLLENLILVRLGRSGLPLASLEGFLSLLVFLLLLLHPLLVLLQSLLLVLLESQRVDQNNTQVLDVGVAVLGLGRVAQCVKSENSHGGSDLSCNG